MPSSQSDATALVDSYLRLLGEESAGEALHGLHDGSALIPSADTLARAADVERAAYALLHQRLCRDGAAVLPRFQLIEVEAEERAVTGHLAVVWARIRVLQTQQALLAAFGLCLAGGKWRLGWSTLAANVTHWSYAQGLAMSLADFAWMSTDTPARARCFLDAAWFRSHWRAPVSFDTLSDTRFSCQMSTACCRHDFEITLPAEAQWLVDALPWEQLQPGLHGTVLPQRPDGKLQLKGVNDTCRFLGPDSLCLIHKAIGRQPFGTCAVFPYSFAKTPEGISVALSPVCASTRQGFGVLPHEREADLRERLAYAQPRSTDTYRLAPDVAVPWSVFKQVEAALCDCLAATDVPMRRRLHVGSRLLGAIVQQQAIETPLWLAEPMAEISPDLRTALRDMLAKILAWDRKALRTLEQSVPATLADLEVTDPAVVARILRNTLYSKVYSYPYDLTTAFNFVVALYLLTLIMQNQAGGKLPPSLWQELGSIGVHGLLKNILHDGVPSGFRAVVGTPEFGQWLLAV